MGRWPTRVGRRPFFNRRRMLVTPSIGVKNQLEQQAFVSAAKFSCTAIERYGTQPRPCRDLLIPRTGLAVGFCSVRGLPHKGLLYTLTAGNQHV